MSDITLVSHLQSIGTPLATAQKPAAAGFADALKSAVEDVNRSQVDADKAVERLQTGESQNLHEVMISMEKADISLRLAVQMRNKVLEAYQEIMRMQI
ncbi:MAG: flagellar hook-basal body complex protein FliE [Desulfuromonadaceae bacterium GWC2_58_13]|nr:MAG: flagellar hook-basal body complex protein FliE [Desulfuromonadaceae bacterium GWC2_58_13]